MAPAWLDGSPRLVNARPYANPDAPRRRRWRLRVLGAACIAAAAGAAWALAVRPPGPSSLSLVDAYPDTIKRSPYGEIEAFSVYDATVGGTTRRVVYARSPGRIIWTMTPPPASELRAWLALRPEAFTQEGNGVVFRIGVSDGRSYRESVTRHVNPFVVLDDRRWIPVVVDLRPFAGRSVDIVFNTDPSPHGVPADGRNDLALWGEPVVAPVR